MDTAVDEVRAYMVGQGVLVNCSDDKLRVDFEVRSLKFYDPEPLRRTMTEEIFRRAKVMMDERVESMEGRCP